LQILNAALLFEALNVVFAGELVLLPLNAQAVPICVHHRIDIGDPVRRAAAGIFIGLCADKRLTRVRPDGGAGGAGLAEPRRAEQQPRIARVVAIQTAAIERIFKRCLRRGVLLVSEQHHAEAVEQFAVRGSLRGFAQDRN